MADAPRDLPEAAQRRFSQGSFSSGLSVSDFGACLEMGLEPVGLVQGFCAMRWGAVTLAGIGRGLNPYSGSSGGYVHNYQCPHGLVSSDHRPWGQNYQQTWVEDAWRTGFNSSFVRMMQEAQALGAHGVIGVVDSEDPLSDTGVVEFHLRGTAVRVADAPASTDTPWSTFLAGQRLAKVFEAGFAPVSIVTSVASVRLWAYCETEFHMDGTGGMWTNTSGSSEIVQVVDAQTKVREIPLTRVRAALQGDALQGASLDVSVRELAKGDYELQSSLKGNRVRRVSDVGPLAVPRPTVRLS